MCIITHVGGAEFWGAIGVCYVECVHLYCPVHIITHYQPFIVNFPPNYLLS